MPLSITKIKSISLWLLLIALSFSQTSFISLPEFTKADLLGDIEPHKHRDFARLRSRYCTKESYLREDCYDAFKDMWKAAEADGIRLTIVSATRNRRYQKGIWNRKWLSFGGAEEDRAERILQYSSMPGTSRHHWGTDIDLNQLNNAYFESGEGAKVYQWLVENAWDYGFFQPYTAFNNFRDKGYREEKWHWSYYPLASRLQRAYWQLVDYPDLKGFMGDDYAKKLEVINNYVMGIEPPAAASAGDH